MDTNKRLCPDGVATPAFQKRLSPIKKCEIHYRRYVKAAVVSHDIEWLRTHYIVSYERVWNYVRFEHIPKVLFEILWSMGELPLSQASFLAGSRRMNLWGIFVSHHGPTACLETALNQKWPDGTIFCLNNGADLSAKDFMRDAMLMEPVIARAIIAANPPANRGSLFRVFTMEKNA